jgi:hypothetical protein
MAGLFERLHEQLGGGSWLIGRVTGSEYAKAEAYPDHTDQTYPREPWFAQRLVRGIWNPHRRQLTRPMQPRQAGRIAPIRLDPIAGTPRDQRWRHHDAFMPVPRQVTLDAIAARPRLIAEPKTHTLAPELAHQTVQVRRRIRDPAIFPDLAAEAALGHRHNDPFLYEHQVQRK